MALSALLEYQFYLRVFALISVWTDNTELRSLALCLLSTKDVHSSLDLSD